MKSVAMYLAVSRHGRGAQQMGAGGKGGVGETRCGRKLPGLTPGIGIGLPAWEKGSVVEPDRTARQFSCDVRRRDRRTLSQRLGMREQASPPA